MSQNDTAKDLFNQLRAATEDCLPQPSDHQLRKIAQALEAQGLTIADKAEHDHGQELIRNQDALRHVMS